MKTLVIAGRLKGLNDYTAACRRNKFAGAKMKKDCEDIITGHILEQLAGVRFENTVRLAFRWYEPNKMRDLDNVCFAKKFILDALVNAEVIKADGWRGVIGFTDQFFIDKDNPRIEVDIEEVGEGHG